MVDVFGDDALAAALLDRVMYPFHVVDIRGNRYRMHKHTDLSKFLDEPDPKTRETSRTQPQSPP